MKTEKKKKPQSEYDVKVRPYLEDIRRYARCGVTEAQLCEFYGIGKTTWAKYKNESPEMTETLCKAKNELKTDLINHAYKVATGFSYEETKTVVSKDKSGKVTSTKETKQNRYCRPDAGMLMFLLINRFPSEFARDPQAIELRKRALELAERNGITPDLEGI